MPKGVYDRNKQEIPDMASETIEAPKTEVKLFPVVLLKNYVPKNTYEIVGYLKKAIEVKNAIGKIEIIEPEKFIPGEMRPHDSPGVGFGEMVMKDGTTVNAKIWAGTTVKLPVDEARRAVALKIAERADEIAA